MAFADLLNKELPSKRAISDDFASFLESDEGLDEASNEAKKLEDEAAATEVEGADCDGCDDKKSTNIEESYFGTDDGDYYTEASFPTFDVLQDKVASMAKKLGFTPSQEKEAVDWLKNNSTEINSIADEAEKGSKEFHEASEKMSKKLLITMPLAAIPVVNIGYLVWAIIQSVKVSKGTENMRKMRNDLLEIKKKLERIDLSKLPKDKRIEVESAIDKIDNALNQLTDKVKTINEDAEDGIDAIAQSAEIEHLSDNDEPDPEDDEDLEREITDAEIDDIAGVDEIDEEDLTPEEEMEATRMMQLAATTMLINDELDEDERADFLESEVDVQIAINEGFVTEADIDEIASGLDMYTEGKIYSKTRVQFNKDARLAQLHAVAINVCARAKRDTDFAKLTKLNRIRKIIRAKLRKRYGQKAKSLMRVYFQRLKKSKSPALQNIAKKNEGVAKESAEFSFLFDESAGRNGASTRAYDAAAKEELKWRDQHLKRLEHTPKGTDRYRKELVGAQTKDALYTSNKASADTFNTKKTGHDAAVAIAQGRSGKKIIKAGQKQGEEARRDIGRSQHYHDQFRNLGKENSEVDRINDMHNRINSRATKEEAEDFGDWSDMFDDQ